MKVLFGSTGLVGQALQEQTSFDRLFSSKNFREISGIKDDIDHLVLCCLPATKWKVNQDPLADLQNIFAILDTLNGVYAKRVTVISTIDVYGHQCSGRNEADFPDFVKPSYGTNRLLFEELISGSIWHQTMQIVRLPAIYHRLIKKNILFDLLNNHQVEQINANSCYQWYPLDHLWQDLAKCPKEGIANLFPAPIETQEILTRFFPDVHCPMGERIKYDHFTIHSDSCYWPPDRDSNLTLMGRFIDEARS